MLERCNWVAQALAAALGSRYFVRSRLVVAHGRLAGVGFAGAQTVST